MRWNSRHRSPNNRTWGYSNTGVAYKPVREIIHYLARAAGNDANLLLNNGPRPDGTIQPEFVERYALSATGLSDPAHRSTTRAEVPSHGGT